MTTYENKTKRIQEIVTELEDKEVSLEKNIDLVKEGTKLANECKKYLNDAELIVKKVVDNKEVEFE